MERDDSEQGKVGLGSEDYKLELCEQCRSGALELREQGWYCPSCRLYTQQVELQHEKLVVPNSYKSNANRAPPSSRQRNAIRHFDNFANRYNMHGDAFRSQMLGDLNKCVGEKRCGNYAGICAAIFFYNYRDELKLSARPFCRDNDLDLHKFNSALFKYVKLRNANGTFRESSHTNKSKEEVLAQTESLLRSLSPQLFALSMNSRERQEQFAEVVRSRIHEQFSAVYDELDWKTPAPLLFRVLKMLHHPMNAGQFVKLCKQRNIYISRKQLSKQLGMPTYSQHKSEASCEPTVALDSNFSE